MMSIVLLALRNRLIWAIGFTTVALSFASPAGADRSELFGPAHVAKLKSIVEAAISPDGKYVAYALAVQRQPMVDDDGPAWTELHVVDSSGQSRPFVTGKLNISQIQWTPDGREIAYVAKRNGDENPVLYTIALDGGESQVRVKHDQPISGVSFCPVDSRIAFLATEPLDEQLKKIRDKGFNQEVYEEDWRPTRVWIVDPKSNDQPQLLDVEGSVSFVQWSPDGRKLALVVAKTSLVDDSYMYKRVKIVDVETGRVVQQINNSGKLGQVGFSADGKHVAMVAAVDIHDPMEGHLMVAEVPGDGSLKDLTSDLDGHVTSFASSKDGTLRCTIDVHLQTTVRSYSLDGTEKTLVAAEGPILSNIRLSADGNTAVFLGHSAQFPTEVFLLTDGTNPQRLTDSNPWLPNLNFARQEAVRYTARDGLELEGVLVYPLNAEPGQRFPLIMTVHGGPEAHVPNGWVTSYSNAGQVGAARGFAVFYPNYRGSTGRGVEFSKMGQADAAGKEFDDIVDAIDYLSQSGLVDKQKVGITGGSYGGYASAWGATYYSNRYAASVMFVGISDNVSKVGTTDIPDEMYLVHHRKRLWDDWDYFRDRSPIRYAEKSKTPTLIMHGKNDPRVHPSQSLELFRHLKTLGQAPVRLVLFEGEGHGNRKAAARLDYHIRMLQWMEHYLQKGGADPPPREIDYEAWLRK